MRIDHVVLEYRNQVPVNATGHVIIEMHDTRLYEGDSKQAELADTCPLRADEMNASMHTCQGYLRGAS